MYVESGELGPEWAHDARLPQSDEDDACWGSKVTSLLLLSDSSQIIWEQRSLQRVRSVHSSQ